MIKYRFSDDKFFQETLHMIDNWINKGSGWIVESIQSKYISISTYRPLSGVSYVKLPAELRSPKKERININSKDQKCFLWCHVRHINPAKDHPERITQEDKKLANDLDYYKIEFLCKKKILAILKQEATFTLTCLVM